MPGQGGELGLEVLEIQAYGGAGHIFPKDADHGVEVFGKAGRADVGHGGQGVKALFKGAVQVE
jgi:hypothetical protein